MSYFVAGLTNVNPAITAPVYQQYPVYVKYNNTLPASATASVSFAPSSDKYRYVIIQRQFDSTDTKPIFLTEVKVFLRGIDSFCNYSNDYDDVSDKMTNEHGNYVEPLWRS